MIMQILYKNTILIRLQKYKQIFLKVFHQSSTISIIFEAIEKIIWSWALFEGYSLHKEQSMVIAIQSSLEFISMICITLTKKMNENSKSLKSIDWGLLHNRCHGKYKIFQVKVLDKHNTNPPLWDFPRWPTLGMMMENEIMRRRENKYRNVTLAICSLMSATWNSPLY